MIGMDIEFLQVKLNLINFINSIFFYIIFFNYNFFILINNYIK